ncbi:Hint domain-containing protein [Donghicola sp. XS_ASV15]|uniref:Hint domain-containing protein n=1 Tax=Donghicola sp. XS_ASV15 TaxID=3241295 RepID=UPI0035154431
MPTTYTDQFYLFDPYAPQNYSRDLSVVVLTYTDSNDDGELTNGVGDTVDGVLVTAVYRGDMIDVRLSDGSIARYRGATFYLEDGRRYFTPTDGQVLQDSRFVETSGLVYGSNEVAVGSDGDMGPPCFTPGTRILTARGYRNVEDIAIGDLVWTNDHGMQPVRWVGSRTVVGFGEFAPVRVKAGALGNKVDMLVSQQHRFLVSGWQVELMTGESEMLAPAKHLVNGDDVVLAPARQVTYIHLMFDQHELLMAEGVLTESFFASGDFVQKDVGVKDELMALFPELFTGSVGGQLMARPATRAYEVTAALH